MNVNKTIIWLLALVLGAILGTLGYASLNTTMDIIATVYTRLFQLLAMPTIVLAVVTTMATMGTKGNTGRIFKRCRYWCHSICIDCPFQPTPDRRDKHWSNANTRSPATTSTFW